jgi:hypothetical protein
MELISVTAAAEHVAQCGPARGFRVCYCTGPCCHRTVDGKPVCVCTDCRALKTCPGNRA